HYVGGEIASITGDPKWLESAARTALKALNFQSIYGGGVPALMAELRITYDEAKRFKMFHDRALPDRKLMSDTLSGILRAGRAVRTYGGRLYVREPLKMENGRTRDFDYRMLNYYCQGSAADITKRAMIRMVNDPDYDSRFMLQVYDE